ncbi:MAG: ATPase [Labilithrix sp.]|nr:ATPase [Labilithrix sp.]
MADDAARKATPLGPKLGRLLDLARDAELPALLVGRHGIGKSEFLEGWARERGVRPYVLDLSLLEATDLTGIPYIERGTTRFAPPATLPPSDAAEPTVLVLEELNRCDRSVRQPCLQLLTTRRLNEYRLPTGCFLVACVNPPETGYDVDEIDEALASRFVTVHVEPDRAAWLAWARTSGVPEVVVSFVERYRQAFDSHPPRTWTFAGKIVAAALARGSNADELEEALRTVLGAIPAQALLLEMRSRAALTPGPSEILRDPRRHLEAMRKLTEERRLDVIRDVLDGLTRLLDEEAGKAALRVAATRAGLREILHVVPPDLARRLGERLVEP